MRSAPIVEVAKNTKNAAQPAMEKKFLLLIRHIPWSSSGGRSCFGFFAVAPAAAFAAVTGAGLAPVGVVDTVCSAGGAGG